MDCCSQSPGRGVQPPPHGLETVVRTEVLSRDYGRSRALTCLELAVTAGQEVLGF